MYQSALVEKQSATYLPPPPTFDSHLSFSPFFFFCCFLTLTPSSQFLFFEHFDREMLCRTRYENANVSLSQQQHQQSDSELKGCPLLLPPPTNLSSYQRTIQRRLSLSSFIFSRLASLCV